MFKNRRQAEYRECYEFLMGTSPPDWLSYGPLPIIISSALHYYTFFFLFVSAALMSIDSSLEEAGELMGASRWRILRKITFPLVVPALLSGFIMTFSKVMGTFGGPNVLGVPVRYYTVSTMIRAKHRGRRQRGCLCAGDHADPLLHDHHHHQPENRRDTEELRDDRRTRLYVPENKAAQHEEGRLDRSVIIFQVLVASFRWSS